MPSIFPQTFMSEKKGERDFQELDVKIKTLIEAAMRVRQNCYCPYSRFPVGAAILTGDGSIYTGCNIENASYPAGICAERAAAAKAVSEGKRDFVACAVVAQQENGYTTPCGLCRQFLSEFAINNDFPLYSCKPGNPPLKTFVTSIRDLLPSAFTFFERKCK